MGQAKSRRLFEDEFDVLERLMEHLDILQKERFTGQIKINYSQGPIGRWRNSRKFPGC